MQRHKMFDVDVADESLTGFASNVTGASFTLTTTATSDGLAHQVSIRNDSVTDHSGKTITLVGTDANDKPLTEVVTAPGTSATVESTGYFKTLTSATPSATIGADTFDIGWVDEVATPTYMLNKYNRTAPNIHVDVTGTISFTVQECFRDLQRGEAEVWMNVSALASKSADTTAQISLGAVAVRLIVDSYSSGAELQMVITQADNG